MTTALQAAGAGSQASEFAPLHTNRIFTGYVTNRSALRDGAISAAAERAGYGRQDSIWDGLNTEISTRLTLVRRPGNTIYNTHLLAPAISFYSFNTFTLSDEAIEVLEDTALDVRNVTGPNTNAVIWTKSPAAIGQRTYFCSIGNLLYFTNGIDNKIYDKDAATLGPLPITHIQSNQGTSVTNSVSVPFTSPNTAHNCLIVVANWQFPSFPGAASISDSLGNTYASPLTDLINATYYNIWVIPDCAGGANTVTLNYPGFSTSVAILAVHEYHNVDSTSAPDARSIMTPPSTLPIIYTPSVTTTAAGDLLFIFAGNGSTAGTFTQTGYTVRQTASVSSGGNAQQLVTMDAIAGAPGVYSQTITLSGASFGNPAAPMIALKAKIGPTGPPGVVYDWGVNAPPTAPTVIQEARPNPYPAWTPNTAFGADPVFPLAIEESTSTNVESVAAFGATGTAEPTWNPPGSVTPDASVLWFNQGPSAWLPTHTYGLQDAVIAAVGGINYLFFCITTPPGVSGATTPGWLASTGMLISDGGVTWRNAGKVLHWSDIGATTAIASGNMIVDPNGYLQTVIQPGKSGATPPGSWATVSGDYTTDNTIIWRNDGPFAPAGTDAVQYGYAYKNSNTNDVGEMSPASSPITIAEGAQVVIQGISAPNPPVDTIVIYRTAQGGSTYFYLDEIPNPGAGVVWTYTDTKTDDELNTEIQAQVNGEGTPLPQGAGPIEYHLGRLFVGVGNVVYVSTGPDAIVSGSSGQAGFNTTFTAQSKIIRFWVTTLGLIVFTVRDSYIILGSATDNDPLYMIKFIPRLPLLSYDCLAEQNTTAFLFLGTRVIVALDPSSGILEASFQISNIVQHYNPKSSYLTYHSEAPGENALYLADGISRWNRMAPTSAPESGANWSVTATIVNGFSAVQSVEVDVGVWRLLLGPSATDQHIRYRDLTLNQDNGAFYPAWATFGSIVMASPGQLAAIAFITLDSEAIGTPAALSVLMNEINPSVVPFESLKRTRQDPPLLPPSGTLYSDRFSLLQKQNPVWCRHFQMRVDWPPENAANELIGFTIFGQLWQEFRSQ